MVNTVHPLAEIFALLADNTSRNISAQDIRDAFFSVFGVYGTIYVQNGAVAQENVTTMPVKMTGFAANGIAANATPDHATDSITINTDGDYIVLFHNGFSGAVNTKFQFRVRVNGVERPFGTRRKLEQTGDVGSCMIIAPLPLLATEVVTVYVESDNAGGASCTPIDAVLFLLKIS